jgi:hypothetical protein
MLQSFTFFLIGGTVNRKKSVTCVPGLCVTPIVSG